MKQCDCEDWKANIDKVLGMGVLAWTHGMEYKGKPEKYCGWCGKELKDENHSAEK